MLIDLFLWLGYFFFFLLIVGLYKPWYMLWWEDVQNRKRVIYLYGSITLGLFLLHLLFSIL